LSVNFYTPCLSYKYAIIIQYKAFNFTLERLKHDQISIVITNSPLWPGSPSDPADPEFPGAPGGPGSPFSPGGPVNPGAPRCPG